MGWVRMGIPEELALELASTFQIKNLIETGTYYGGTTEWASHHFKSVHTIEFSKTIFEATSAKLKHLTNIRFRFGDSRAVLKEIQSEISGPSLFWLDAHWCSGDTYGKEDQCPLLEELRIINEQFPESYILIDDARLFIAAPPENHIGAQWPDLSSLMITLCAAKEPRHVAIFEDVLIAVPLAAKTVVSDYCRRTLSEEGNRLAAEYRRTPFDKAILSIQESLKLFSISARMAIGRFRRALFGRKDQP
ncbi:MAG: hypothetical protein SGI71_11935 [Verrucomicrobiota bacterium]|nr:hypothetical protein [Verrucomicrobiota bacterium]